MIVDGRAIAQDILREVKSEVEALGKTVVVRAVCVAPNPATRSYLKIKNAKALEAGMVLEVVELAESATAEEAIEAVKKEGADAVIVQLPLPMHIDMYKVVNSIPLEKDADVLSDTAYRKFEIGEKGALVPPVAGAVQEILERNSIEVRDTDVAVVGGGKLVGKPVAELMRHLGARVTVLLRRDFESNASKLKTMSTIVSGVGVAGLITPELIGEDVVLIDAGTSESEGELRGDIAPSCAPKARIYTPVPGGVGPIAVACLFRNVILLAK